MVETHGAVPAFIHGTGNARARALQRLAGPWADRKPSDWRCVYSLHRVVLWASQMRFEFELANQGVLNHGFFALSKWKMDHSEEAACSSKISVVRTRHRSVVSYGSR